MKRCPELPRQLRLDFGLELVVSLSPLPDKLLHPDLFKIIFVSLFVDLVGICDCSLCVFDPFEPIVVQLHHSDYTCLWKHLQLFIFKYSPIILIICYGGFFRVIPTP